MLQQLIPCFHGKYTKSFRCFGGNNKKKKNEKNLDRSMFTFWFSFLNISQHFLILYSR
ncbi:hypothetical protein C0J52_22207 [Blattella germanica]|nr:hypothetical protein C0J52_22207 [Blattella germanica]